MSLCALPYFNEVVNDEGEAGWTPLLTACSKSNKTDLRVIKLLVENGADVLKAKKTDGLAPIHFAASNNDVHFLDYILTSAVENPSKIVNVTSNEGWTPAMLAGFLNNFDSLNLLMENGADLQIRNKNGLSTFDEVVRNDHSDLFECVWPYAKLIKRDLNKQASFGFLHLAAGQEGSKTLEFLLNKCKETPNQICNKHD